MMKNTKRSKILFIFTLTICVSYYFFKTSGEIKDKKLIDDIKITDRLPAARHQEPVVDHEDLKGRSLDNSLLLKPVKKHILPKKREDFVPYSTSVEKKHISNLEEGEEIFVGNSSYHLLKDIIAVSKEDYIEGKYEKIGELNTYILVKVDQTQELSGLRVVKDSQTNNVAIFTGILKIKFYDYENAYKLKDLLIQNSNLEVQYEISEEKEYIRIAFLKFDSYDETMAVYSALIKDEYSKIIERITIDLIQWKRINES